MLCEYLAQCLESVKMLEQAAAGPFVSGDYETAAHFQTMANGVLLSALMHYIVVHVDGHESEGGELWQGLFPPGLN